MKSLRTKITVMTLLVVVVAVTIVTILSVIFIIKTEHRESDQLLLLLCETGERNLDYYFNSVQKSVEKVASFAEKDIDDLDDKELQAHVDRVEKYFDEMASKTNGVLTYYYRIDPEVSKTVKGFWYTDLDGEGFTEHEVTDITKYDTSDTSSLVWFTVPKYQGRSIWLPPYITDNLDKRVISYNVPIYRRGDFVGVIGIEIDYSVMAEQVDSIRLYENGYAFLNDSEGNLFYHPRIDVSKLTPEAMPPVPDGIVGDSTFITYNFEGVDKKAAWLQLGNGMRLNVTVPVSETDGDWQMLIYNILILAVEVLIAASLFTMFYSKRITKPLEELTEAANMVDMENYDFRLDYDRDDELGRLTNTFKRLANNMRNHINDLNEQVYVDSLTLVKNKGAFASYSEELQAQIDNDRENIRFAVGIFDCDNLKKVNDVYGHDKGDIYIKKASHLICSTFSRSPVFRIGGDEFSVVLKNQDYENREELIASFEKEEADISAAALNKWEEVHLSMGIAEFDPATDRSLTDVVRRADKMMYEYKKKAKESC